MFTAPLRFFRPSVEYNLTIRIEALPLDKNSLDSTDLKSAHFDPDPIELGDNTILHSYLDPLYREKSPAPRSPARSPLLKMSTQYDQIGSRHKSLEDSPVGEVDFESTSKALGDVSGLKVLDLACGIGRWSKWLVNNGAKEVVGIDISEGMIKGAKEMQAGLPNELAQKLDFSVKDCGLPLTVEEGGFDLVLGAWYLSNAADHAGLVAMFRNILINLKPGGRFLGIVPNAFTPMFEPYLIYGLGMERNEQAAEGHWKCTLSYKADNIAFKTNIRLHGLYEKAAKEAGLGEIRWRPYVLPKGDQREEQGFWDEFKLRPHLCLLECYKPA